MTAPEKKVRLYNCQDVSFDEALASECDIAAQSQQYNDTIALKVRLYENAPALRQLVAAHLGLESARIQIDIPQNWRQGSFNLVLPVLIYGSIYDRVVEKPMALNPTDYPTGVPPTASVRRVVLRWPIPGRCGETYHPGAVLEKMSCEVASYIWMQHHCPDVRIPQLYGFGLPTGQHVRLYDSSDSMTWHRLRHFINILYLVYRSVPPALVPPHRPSHSTSYCLFSTLAYPVQVSVVPTAVVTIKHRAGLYGLGTLWSRIRGGYSSSYPQARDPGPRRTPTKLIPLLIAHYACHCAYTPAQNRRLLFRSRQQHHRVKEPASHVRNGDARERGRSTRHGDGRVIYIRPSLYRPAFSVPRCPLPVVGQFRFQS